MKYTAISYKVNILMLVIKPKKRGWSSNKRSNKSVKLEDKEKQEKNKGETEESGV